MKVRATFGVRFNYVLNYGLPPGVIAVIGLPGVAGWSIFAVTMLATAVRAWPMGITVDDQRVVVRNFLRQYVVARESIVEVKRVEFWGVPSWPITTRTAQLRLRDGGTVLVIAGNAGYRKVFALLETLGVPVEGPRIWIDFDGMAKRLLQRVRRRKG